ncbi:ATP-binding cassette domain-containing protein [Treponema pectinovorum]|uniref:ATP-binding cassette domain-containing protein n=1 Tax=Treponema pectinovorum TaxID=164 RepID=UPI0011F33183|nr:dipeptide/oligopeptide/nickel ABC transporter ATP-binding protein [Treponema pectinovorum]
MTETILECKNLYKSFNTKNSTIKAVDGINLSVKRGECYGLVGESGSGKSTLSSLICAIQNADSGEIVFDGQKIFDKKENSKNLFQKKRLQTSNKIKEFRKKCQIIFQDSSSSLNPKMKIASIIEEPLIIHKIAKSKKERLGLVNEMRTLVGLPPDCLEKYPSQLSGGQRQRVAIAAAMILKPEFVICDECVSALDVLIQSQILNLLKSMQKSLNLTYIFISHNLNVVAYMADRIGVMYRGKIIEEKTTEILLESPEQDYTKSLLFAAGLLDSND